jgi:O-antigen ligase
VLTEHSPPAASWLERATFVVAFLAMMDLAIPFLELPEESGFDTTEGNRGFQILIAGIYLVIAAWAVPRLPRMLRDLKRQKALLVIVALAFASILWSGDPALTARRSAALLCTTLVGVYAAARFRPAELLRLVGWAIGVSALLSVVAVALDPAYAIHVDDKHEGAWRGIFSQKNIMARWMCVGVLLFLVRFINAAGWWARIASLGWVIACVWLIWMTGSTTGVALAALIIVGLPCLRALRGDRSLVAAGVALLLPSLGVAVVWLLEEGAGVLAGIGKDATLTGRTPLWGLAVEDGLQRPWLGHGFRAFWSSLSAPAFRITHHLGWEAASGHNSFLDLWLELGALGLAVFMLMFLRFARDALKRAREGRDGLGLWYLGYFMFLFIISMIQTVLLSPNSGLWVLFVAGAVQVRMLADDSQGTSTAGAEATAERVA